jgi:hypothetical protein
MGYTVHDWFDDKFNPKSINEFLVRSGDDPTLFEVLKGTLNLEGYSFNDQCNSNSFIMLLLEALFDLDKVYGLHNKFYYVFDLVEPKSKLMELIYKSHTATVSISFESKINLKFSDLFSFYKNRKYDLSELIINLGNNEDNDDSDCYFSSLDIFLRYLKSLGNRNILRDLVTKLFYIRFETEDLSEISTRMYSVFNTLIYEDELELVAFRYLDGGSKVDVRLDSLVEEAE